MGLKVIATEIKFEKYYIDSLSQILRFNNLYNILAPQYMTFNIIYQAMWDL